MEKQTYEVTPLAGSHVAGQRVKIGDKLALTEEEACTELLAGVIVQVLQTPLKPPSKKD